MKYFSNDAIEKLRVRVLSDAVEDYTGLWELVPVAERTLGRSAFSLLVEALRNVVLDLDKDGLVAFYQGNPQPGDQPMDSATAADLIRSEGPWVWDQQENAKRIWLGALPKGERRYYAKPGIRNSN